MHQAYLLGSKLGLVLSLSPDKYRSLSSLPNLNQKLNRSRHQNQSRNLGLNRNLSQSQLPSRSLNLG